MLPVTRREVSVPTLVMLGCVFPETVTAILDLLLTMAKLESNSCNGMLPESFANIYRDVIMIFMPGYSAN